MNVLREQKIKDVKELIAKKVSLPELKKLKFKGSTPAMKKWVKGVLNEDTEEKLLTREELIYLEILKDDKPKTEDKKPEAQPVVKESVVSDKQEQQFTKEEIERLKKLTSNELFKFIMKLYEDSKLEVKEEKTGVLHISNIDSKYFNLQNLVNKNCRVSIETYERFTLICQKNNFTITSVLNFLLDQFCSQNQ